MRGNSHPLLSLKVIPVSLAFASLAHAVPQSLLEKVGTSALDPAGPAAEKIAALTWVMIVGFGLLFVFIMGLLIIGIKRGENSGKSQAPLGDRRFVVIGGLLMPLVILLLLLVYTLLLTASLGPKESRLKIRVTGHMWWWDVYYPESNLRIANEIYIPAGEPILIELVSKDVIHSFWVPSLAGKTDLVPGITNYQWLEADRPGTYRAQCAEFCGLQHARMALYVVALPPEEFAKWLASKQRSQPVPQDPRMQAGLATFVKAGCGECHTIQGTEARGLIGPDLTHVGSRLSLGAGTIPNSYGSMAGWVANPQALKPGNKMPPSYVASQDYHSLISYLMSLQ